jgi:carbamate kinase
VRIVVALGGNALLRRGEPMDAAVQFANVRAAARALAPLAREHEMIVTHGNGPQVGLLALQNESYAGTPPYPLDVLGAQTQGMIGYMIEDELRDELQGAREVVTLLTEVLVGPDDPAFAAPSKPIGPVYSEAEARALAATRGWTVGPDGGHWRRLVPSPEPIAIIEVNAIRLLVRAGVVVICGGGGGIPVVREPSGALRGVQAVIDKDLLAALLGTALEADALVMLTDVDAVYEGWGTPDARALRRATPARLRSMSFASGSMAPKVEAACRFVEPRVDTRRARDGHRSGCFAAIGALGDAGALIKGEKGTRIESG